MIGDLDIAALMLLTPGLAFFCPGFLCIPKLAFLALILLPFFQDHKNIKVSFIKYFSAKPQPNVSIFSDSSTILRGSSIVDTGHTMLPSLSLDLRHVPQARILPPVLRNFLIVPSRNGNFASFTSSTSTPFPRRKTFTA